MLRRPLRLPSWLPPGLCSILFLTGWQGLLFLPWRMFRYVMRPTRPQGLPWAVLSVAACFQAAPLTQWRPPQGMKLRSVMLSGLLLQPLLRLLHRLLRLPSWLTPGLCSILFLTGWQGLPWTVLSAEVSLLAALLIQ